MVEAITDAEQVEGWRACEPGRLHERPARVAIRTRPLALAGRVLLARRVAHVFLLEHAARLVMQAEDHEDVEQGLVVRL